MDIIEARNIPQLLWVVNSILMILLGFMVKNWMKGISNDIHLKCDQSMCDEKTKTIERRINQLLKHKHPIQADRNITEGVMIE